MAEKDTTAKGRLLLAAKDFVDVVDADGKALPPVPKHWGVDQLPAGAEKKSKSNSSSTSSSSSQREPRKTGDEPPKSGAGSSTEEWVAYAKEKGATDADLLDANGEPLKQAALVEKFGTKA